MVVNVGSFSDPEGLEGLAHFLGMIKSILSMIYGKILRSVYWYITWYLMLCWELLLQVLTLSRNGFKVYTLYGFVGTETREVL